MVSALRFLFTNALDRPDLARKLVRVSSPRNLPVVLSRDEMARLTPHPHIHMIGPGGGITQDGRWISSRPAFLLPVRVLGVLFRQLFLSRLPDLH